jgi:hypothetical protein
MFLARGGGRTDVYVWGAWAMTKQALEQRLQAQAKMWDTLLELLQTSVCTAEAETRAACARDYNTLCAKGSEVAEKLAVLKTRDDDSWQDLGTDVERTWRDMAESVRDLVERLHGISNWFGKESARNL